MRLGWLLLGLIGAQGAIGYTQYFTGLPAGLVWVHVTGSLLIWIAVLRLMFAMRDRGPLIQPPPESPGGPAASALPRGPARPGPLSRHARRPRRPAAGAGPRDGSRSRCARAAPTAGIPARPAGRRTSRGPSPSA